MSGETGFEHVPDEVLERDFATTAQRVRRAMRDRDLATLRYERARLEAMKRELASRDTGRER